MVPLRIAMLGSLRLAGADGVALELPTRAAQSLLVYLLLNRGRLLPRELLAGLFWGESPESRARAALSTTLWRLRQVLEPEGVTRGAYLTVSHAGDLGFNARGDFSLDIEAFERGTSVLRPGRPLQPEAAAELAAATELYAGDLLPGFYEEWVLRERERLRQLFIRALYELMRYHGARGEFEQSLAHGQRLLAADPLREEVQREMMRLYARAGQRPLALRQYEICRAALSAELGVAPLPETTALFRELRRAGDAVAVASVPASPAPAAEGVSAADLRVESAYRAVRRAMRQLRTALRGLEDARGGQAEPPAPRGHALGGVPSDAEALARAAEGAREKASAPEPMPRSMLDGPARRALGARPPEGV